jgi:hypothetical protein
MHPILNDIINPATAPLMQWENAIGEPLSEGKKREDALIYPAIIGALIDNNAQAVTGIIADEARLELNISENIPEMQNITHLTLRGRFGTVAQRNVMESGNHVVRVTTRLDTVKPGSQGAVVTTLILGCLSSPEDNLQNIRNVLRLAESLLKPDGELIIVRPNPARGAFPTYKCLTPASELCAGQNYDFMVGGLESEGSMKNLYTPDNFLRTLLNEFGMSTGGKPRIIRDKSAKAMPGTSDAPFLINACAKLKKTRPRPAR